MKKFKENRSPLQRFNDWLNAYKIDGDRGGYVALFRHFCVLVAFTCGMFLLAVWVLKSSGV
jgi:hypothetical protein